MFPVNCEYLSRRVIRRGVFHSSDDLRKLIVRLINYYNGTMAKPYKWTYACRPLSEESNRKKGSRQLDSVKVILEQWYQDVPFKTGSRGLFEQITRFKSSPELVCNRCDQLVAWFPEREGVVRALDEGHIDVASSSQAVD